MYQKMQFLSNFMIYASRKSNQIFQIIVTWGRKTNILSLNFACISMGGLLSGVLPDGRCQHTAKRFCVVLKHAFLDKTRPVQTIGNINSWFTSEVTRTCSLIPVIDRVVLWRFRVERWVSLHAWGRQYWLLKKIPLKARAHVYQISF